MASHLIPRFFGKPTGPSLNFVVLIHIFPAFKVGCAARRSTAAYREGSCECCRSNLKTSLDEWLLILAVYQSTVEGQPVDLPFDPPDDMLDRFKRFVGV